MEILLVVITVLICHIYSEFIKAVTAGPSRFMSTKVYKQYSNSYHIKHTMASPTDESDSGCGEGR